MKRVFNCALWLLVGVLLAGTPIASAQQANEIFGRTGYQGQGGAPTYSPGLLCNKTAIYDASTNGSTELVALSSGKTVYVCGFTFLAAGSVNVKLISGTGTACATGSADMTPAFRFTAQVGVVDGSPFYRGLNGGASRAVCLNTSAGIATEVIIYYVQF